MLKRLLFLCFATAVVLVAANPSLQINPSQTCPICQQNAYRNIPTNIPFVIQQPTTHFNPYSQMNWPQNPVVQTCPQPQVEPTCNKQVTSSNDQLNQELLGKILSNPTLRSILNPNTKLYNQNGINVPRHMPLVSKTAPVPNVINNYIIVPPELLLNDTKGNPKDKETKVGNGEQRRRNSSSRNQGGSKDSRRKNQDNNIGRKETSGRSKNQRNRSESKDGPQRKIKTTQKERESDCDDVGAEKNKQKSRRRPKNRKRTEEKRFSTVNNEVTKEIKLPETSEADLLDQKQISAKDTNEKNSHQSEASSQAVPYNDQNLNLINYQNYERALKQYNSKLNEGPRTQSIERPNNSDHNSSQPFKMEERKTASTNREKSKRKNNEQNGVCLKINAAQRNPQEETVIQDLQAKFPGIPEEVVRSLLSHLKRQLQDEKLGASKFYYPGFPMNYDQLQHMQFSGVSNNNGGSNNERNSNSRINNGRRKNRRNQNKRKGQRNKNSENTDAFKTTVELNSSLIANESTTISPTTTENPISIKAETESYSKKDDVTTELDDFVETTTTKSPPRHMSNIDFDYNTQVPELGMEDIVPTIYLNGIIDDYYPDFTSDNEAFVVSQEEYGLKNLQENRYHYTTDKNYEIEELNREMKKYERNYDNNFHSDKPIIENNIYKSHITNKEQNERPFEIENTLKRPQDIRSVEDIEEIQFRTPPTLELPDFETRKVDKLETIYEEEFDADDDDIYADSFTDKRIDGVDKISTYSNFKTPQYNTRDKPSNERRNLRKRSKSDVETVFARSKVAKYGQTPEFPEDETTLTSRGSVKEKTAKNERYQYKTDSDPTIVIAKSIPGEYWLK